MIDLRKTNKKDRVATSASEMEIEVPMNNFDDMTIFGLLTPDTPVGVTTMSFLKNLVRSASSASGNDIINALITRLAEYKRYGSHVEMSEGDRLKQVIQIAREFAEFHDTITEIKEATTETLEVVPNDKPAVL